MLFCFRREETRVENDSRVIFFIAAGWKSNRREGGGRKSWKMENQWKGGKGRGMDGWTGNLRFPPGPPPPSPFRSHRRLRQSTTTLYGTHEREALFYNPLCLPLPPFAGRKKRDPPTVQPVQEESLYLCLFLPKKVFSLSPSGKKVRQSPNELWISFPEE